MIALDLRLTKRAARLEETLFDDPEDPWPWEDRSYLEEEFTDPVEQAQDKILNALYSGNQVSYREGFTDLYILGQSNPVEGRELEFAVAYALQGMPGRVALALSSLRRFDEEFDSKTETRLMSTAHRAAVKRYKKHDPRFARAHLLYAKELEAGQPFRGVISRSFLGDPFDSITLRSGDKNRQNYEENKFVMRYQPIKTR